VQIVQNILPTAYISTLRVKVSAKRKTKQHILNKSFRFSANCAKHLADSVHQYAESKIFVQGALNLESFKLLDVCFPVFSDHVFCCFRKGNITKFLSRFITRLKSVIIKSNYFFIHSPFFNWK